MTAGTGNLYQSLSESATPVTKETPPKLPPSGIYRKGSLSYEGIMSTILKTTEDSTGAVATYVGLTKSPGFAGTKVEELQIGTEQEYSTKAFRRICDEVKKKFSLQLAVIYHYEGKFRPGEILVIAAVAGKARPETFSALQELVSRFKPEGHLRKKEFYEDGESEWIEK
jgi:molybdopterin synthase catalytic subunit